MVFHSFRLEGKPFERKGTWAMADWLKRREVANQKRSNLNLVVCTVQISTYSYSYIGGTKRRLYDRETGHFKAIIYE